MDVGDGPPADFVSAAFEHLLGRLPTDAEHAAAIDGLERLTAVESAVVAASNGAEASEPGSTTPRDRARAALIHVLLNHNDFVTIR
jgi:hypothetical protein